MRAWCANLLIDNLRNSSTRREMMWKGWFRLRNFQLNYASAMVLNYGISSEFLILISNSQ